MASPSRRPTTRSGLFRSRTTLLCDHRFSPPVVDEHVEVARAGSHSRWTSRSRSRGPSLRPTGQPLDVHDRQREPVAGSPALVPGRHAHAPADRDARGLDHVGRLRALLAPPRSRPLRSPGPARPRDQLALAGAPAGRPWWVARRWSAQRPPPFSAAPCATLTERPSPTPRSTLGSRCAIRAWLAGRHGNQDRHHLDRRRLAPSRWCYRPRFDLTVLAASSLSGRRVP